MSDTAKQKSDLQELLNETTVALGGTDQTYIQFVKMLNDYDQLSIPNRLMAGYLVFSNTSPSANPLFQGIHITIRFLLS